MQPRTFGQLGDISALTLGGGGIGQVWGPTTRAEAMATVREAWAAGITFFDVAPSYGRGEAEVVLGEAFGGRLPAGVRVSTKCAVGNRAAREVLPLLERSLDESLARLQLERVDLFFLHNQIVPDASADQSPGTPHRLFVEAVRPAFEQLVARGRIGAWGITGIGVPTTIIATLNDDPAPAAVQVSHNLDSSWRRIIVERRDDCGRDPDTGDAPGPNAATGDELLKSRTHRLDKQAVGCPRDLVGARIRDDLIVQEEEVNPVEPHAGQTLVQTPLQQGQDLAGGPVADGTLGRDAYAWRQSAPTGLAEDHLGFARTIAGCHIEPGDASLPGRTHGRHRLVAGGGTPDLPNAATAEGEGTDVTELPKNSLLHG